MYLSVQPPIAFPLSYEDGQVYGLGASLPANTPLSTTIETSIAASMLAAIPFSGPAAPFLAAGAAIATLLAKFGVGSGCGQTCILSTQYANAAEAALNQNITTYFSLPAPRDPVAQQTALALFDTVWADLEQQCSAASLGTAGQKCISDRQAGACTWKQSSTSSLLPYPGEPQPGACWNWFSGYRDPIANDPDVGVATAGSEVTGAVDSIAASVGGMSTTTLLLLAAGAAVVVWAVAS